MPLLVVHLLRRIAASNPEREDRGCFPAAISSAEPSVATGFIDSLVRQAIPHEHTRARGAGFGKRCARGRADARAYPRPPRLPVSARPSKAPRSKLPSASTLEGALLENDWNLEQTWRALGLRQPPRAGAADGQARTPAAEKSRIGKRHAGAEREGPRFRSGRSVGQRVPRTTCTSVAGDTDAAPPRLLRRSQRGMQHALSNSHGRTRLLEAKQPSGCALWRNSLRGPFLERL